MTTKLDTMNRIGTHPYGASKAALEMATEVWAKDVDGTGLTINIVNPGAGANTPGMAAEMREMSRDGRAARLVEPDEMVPPLLYVVSRDADKVNGYRFDANLWDASLPPAEAARRAGRPCRLRNAPAGCLREQRINAAPGVTIRASRLRVGKAKSSTTTEVMDWRSSHTQLPNQPELGQGLLAVGVGWVL